MIPGIGAARAGGFGGNDANTILLSHFDGSAVDVSATAAALALAGTASIGTSAPTPQFGYGDLALGSSGYLEVTNNASLNALAALTIEMQSYRSAPVFNTNGANTYAWMMCFGTSVYMSSTGSSWNLINGSTTGWTAPASVFTHFAVTWDGTTIRFLQGGALTASYAIATAPGATGNWRFGTAQASADVNGVYDEIRVSKVARWTAAFAPPTQPYD